MLVPPRPGGEANLYNCLNICFTSKLNVLIHVEGIESTQLKSGKEQSFETVLFSACSKFSPVNVSELLIHIVRRQSILKSKNCVSDFWIQRTYQRSLYFDHGRIVKDSSVCKNIHAVHFRVCSVFLFLHGVREKLLPCFRFLYSPQRK